MNERINAEKQEFQIEGQIDLTVDLEYQALSIHIPCYSTAFRHRAILPSPSMLVKYL